MQHLQRFKINLNQFVTTKAETDLYHRSDRFETSKRWTVLIKIRFTFNLLLNAIYLLLERLTLKHAISRMRCISWIMEIVEMSHTRTVSPMELRRLSTKGPFKKYVTVKIPIFDPPSPPCHRLSPFALTPLPPLSPPK